MSIVQQSLFPLDDFADKRTVPLIVADKWRFPLAYIDQDGNADHYLYAGSDWFQGLGGSRNHWTRTRDDLHLSTVKLPYVARDGKTYQIDFLTQEQLYQVAIEMRPMKKRPQLELIRAYLAKAGVFADKARRDPKWAAARLEGQVARSAFTDALSENVTDLTRSDYATATNDVYRGVFHREASELKQALHADKVRDHMSTPALMYLGIAEWASGQRIGEEGAITFSEARNIIRDESGIVGEQVEDFEHRFGIDIVTGKPPLPADIAQEHSQYGNRHV